jgi:hypothetical protein
MGGHSPILLKTRMLGSDWPRRLAPLFFIILHSQKTLLGAGGCISQFGRRQKRPKNEGLIWKFRTTEVQYRSVYFLQTQGKETHDSIQPIRSDGSSGDVSSRNSARRLKILYFLLVGYPSIAITSTTSLLDIELQPCILLSTWNWDLQLDVAREKTIRSQNYSILAQPSDFISPDPDIKQRQNITNYFT